MIVNKFEAKKGVKNLILKMIPPVYFENRLNKRYKEKFEGKYPELKNRAMPDTVQIETINRCNGTCSFCPVNKNVDTRKMKKMDEELYKKIIDDLSRANYKGRIAMFSNNEPLLDNRVLEFTKLAREKLPEAYIYIYTNGTLMTKEICLGLAEYMDEIIIDNYNNDLELNPNILEIHELCKENVELDKKVQIHLRMTNEVLYTRGGQSPNNQKQQGRKYPCFLPFTQMVIRPDGKVSLCCSDALGKMTLGDVSTQTVEEIWNSKGYNEIREKIVNDITSIDLCKYCDSKHEN